MTKPNAVVSPEGLEAGAREAFGHSHPHRVWEECPEEGRVKMRDTFRHGLEAAGMVAAEEFWEVERPATIKICDEDKPRTSLFMSGLLPGDKLYIVRGQDHVALVEPGAGE